MKTATRNMSMTSPVKIGALIAKSVFCAAVLTCGTSWAAPIVSTWAGTAGDNNFQNTNNWSPLTAGRPTASSGDTLQFNGTVAGNLLLTNMTGNSGSFDANPGFYVNVTAGQTGSVTISESNTFTGRIRLNGTNTLNVASGAGAFSFGNGGTVPLPIALAGKGTGETHPCTNNSANTVTFNSETYFVMGGGGSHTLMLGGTGNWQVNSTFQAQNSGSSLGLTVNGSGVVNLVGTPVSGVTYAGSFGNVTVNSGTLVLGSASAIGNGNTLVLTGGNLDSAVSGLVNAGNNPQSWNGNFGFIGTQSLNLGLGPVTMNANRTITVNANTLTVGGAISGSGFKLIKAGAGTLAVNGGNSYSGGTVISNGVLQLGSGGAIPSGSAVSESVTNFGTLDLNGNSITLSSLYGTGIVDTVSGGSPTLTVGDQNANGSFSGVIQNTSGSMSLVQNGTGVMTLGGANTYSGGTSVNVGTLLVTNTSGSGTGSGAVTVASGAIFGGSGSVSGAVTWQSGSQGSFIVGSPLTVNNSATLNGNSLTINVPGAIPLGAGTYPLMTYHTSGSSGSFSSSSLQYTGAGVSPGTSSSVSTSAGTVTLTVVSTVNGTHATWTNTISGNWSVATNWDSNPTVPHAPGDLATLGIGSSYTTVTLDAAESIGGVVFTNVNSFDIANIGNTLTFDNSGSGAIISVAAGTSNLISTVVSLNDNLFVSAYPGTALAVSNNVTSTSSALTMSVSGGGTLTLNGNNTYGPSAGTIGSTLIGSTVQLSQNTGLAAGDVSVIGGSTIRALAPVTLANNLIVSNGATASLDNNGNAVNLSGTVSGPGGLGKNGQGTLTVSGANSYNGTTSISAGTLQLGNTSAIPGGTGDGNINMGTNTLLDLHGFSPSLDEINASFASALIDNLSATPVTLTLGGNGGFGTYSGNIQNSQGAISLALNDTGGQQTLSGTNTYSGGTTITAGTLQVGNGNTNAAAGLGTGPVSIASSGTLQFNLVGTNSFTNAISGAGQLNLNNNNLTLVLSNANTFTGNVNVNGGSIWIKNSSAMGVGPSGVGSKNINVANGTAGNSQIHLDGSLGNLNLDSSLAIYLSNVNGNLFNESGSNTINGPIFMPFGGGSPLIVVKSGFLNFAGPTISSDGTANARILTLSGGNGLVSSSFQDNNGQTCSAQVNSGTWTLTGASTTVGNLTAQGGTMIFNGSWAGLGAINSGGTLTGTGSVNGATMTVGTGGNFVPGAYGSVGTFTVASNLVLSGATYVSLNKSLIQSNTLVTVGVGTLANTGSTLIVSNLGPALAVGDTFTFFTTPVTNGNTMTLTLPSLPAGLAFTNNLALNGSISIYAVVATNPTNITSRISGNQLILSWPADHTGWHLQAQTNSLSTGLGTNWVTIAGSNASNGYTNAIDPANGTVFYRMVYP